MWNKQNWASICLLAVLSGFLIFEPAMAQDEATDEHAPKIFDGFYAGVDIGRQNVIGGSLVNGIDVLAQDSRTVVSFFGGFRKQFAGGFVLGAEGGYGVMDGDLALADPANQLFVAYDNNSQFHYGLILGHTLGSKKDMLLFGYVSEVSRSFDVAISSAGSAFTQTDEQGLLRFGAGIEKHVAGPFLVRATAGTSRADFGGAVTNIDPATKFDASAALIVQF